jgi:Tetratricopeptide repeat
MLIAAWVLLNLRAGGAETTTFAHDIAPVIFEHCAECHRPGRWAPFPLLTFGDVRKHGKDIVDVTARRFMPPWLPEAPAGEFVGDRRLKQAEIDLFKRWYDAGMPEGDPAQLPPTPGGAPDWQLGTPDYLVEAPAVYTLAAEGRDVYRNFVLPNPLKAARHIRAAEFHADNLRVVHHAFVMVDHTGRIRLRDGVDGAPGFDGMNTLEGVTTPKGYFVGWQPGKRVTVEPPGSGWTLEPGQDLLVQAHMRPTGKPEKLRVSVGLFFSDTAPTNIQITLPLNALGFDLKPGEDNNVVEDELTLPAPVEVVGVLPHAHYLGRHLEGIAELPDGSTRTLLNIPDWDFNWQGDYRYARPIPLPAGTILRMRFQYDNTEANPRNPSHPPREVLYGPQSSDEMAELWYQFRLASESDGARIMEANNRRQAERNVALYRLQLEKNPTNATARMKLGLYLWSHKKTQQAADAFTRAGSDAPGFDQPHYYLGLLHRQAGRTGQALAELETAVRLNPSNAPALSNLGILLAGAGRLDDAEKALRKATEVDPVDARARAVLEEFLKARAPGGGR